MLTNMYTLMTSIWHSQSSQ